MMLHDRPWPTTEVNKSVSGRKPLGAFALGDQVLVEPREVCEIAALSAY
jgi:hypothetical protein